MKVAEQDAKPWTLNSQEKTLKRWGKGEACVTSPESLSAGGPGHDTRGPQDVRGGAVCLP